MSVNGKCKFYRASQSLSMGQGIGYCDLDCVSAICEGDTHFCENLDLLKKHLMQEKVKKFGDAGMQEEKQATSVIFF